MIFKESLVKELLEDRIGSKVLSAKHSISAPYLRRLAKHYEDQGSLSHKEGNNFYDKTFKIACVLSVIKKKLSLTEVATCFGTSTDGTIIHWMKLYGEFGEDGLFLSLFMPLHRK